jgi:hypothetical protein
LEARLVSPERRTTPALHDQGRKHPVNIGSDRVAHQIAATLQEKAKQARVALAGTAFEGPNEHALTELADYLVNLDRDDGRLHAFWTISGIRGLDMDDRFYLLSEKEQDVASSLGRPLGVTPDAALNSFLDAAVEGAFDHIKLELTREREKAASAEDFKTRLDAANERITPLEAERDALQDRVNVAEADAADFRARYEYVLSMLGPEGDGPNGKGAPANKPAPRRQRVEGEPHLYSTVKADDSVVYEVGWKDEDGKQRWKRTGAGLEAARRLRDELTTQEVTT